MSMCRTHSIIDVYSHNDTAGLKLLLVEYLLMQNRYMGEEDARLKKIEGLVVLNGGLILVTDLCPVMRSDLLQKIRGLGEMLTSV